MSHRLSGQVLGSVTSSGDPTAGFEEAGPGSNQPHYVTGAGATANHGCVDGTDNVVD
ncbi:hypothetical protein [Kitasatospora terrestris]|uniref:Uncharacterized protein n=1 Tax=Kitasatospora terrestris TaxID=258051 RepID=A0ABP9DA15_9ACTN